MFIGKCYFEPPTELWSKGLVFLKALRECLHWSFRTADPYMVLAYTQDGYAAPSHTRVLLTRGPYCLSLTTNEQLGFERGSTSSGFNRKKPTSSTCSMVHHSAGIWNQHLPQEITQSSREMNKHHGAYVWVISGDMDVAWYVRNKGANREKGYSMI